MTTTLSEGVKVPDVGSVNWAGDLEVNWNLLNGALANLSGNVKLDRDNTWTGEQSFTLPIVGSITGTASKAIADEDGTSIKTGYVNVAGNQTVSGQKTWSGENLYTSNLNVSGFRIRLYDSTDDWTVTPTNAVIKEIDFTDKNNSVISYFAFQHRSNTTEPFRTCWRQNKKDGTTDYYSVNFNNLGEFYPEISNTKLGTSSNQWSSVYAQNYYYNGTEFQSKFVTTDTSQSISSQKTFNANLICTSSIYTRNNDYTLGTIPTSSITATNRFVDKSNADFGYVRGVVYTDGRTVAELKARNKFTNGALNPSGSNVESTLIVGIDSTGSTYVQFNGRLQNGLIPTITGSYDLGTSTNQWKTLNGVNPGGLSFPDHSNLIDVSGSIVPPFGESTINYSGGYNTFTPSVDGWLSIRLDGASFLQIYRNTYNCPGTTVTESSGTRKLVTTLPVRANTTYTIVMEGNPTNTKFHLYPCLGNV